MLCFEYGIELDDVVSDDHLAWANGLMSLHLAESFGLICMINALLS